MCQPTVKPPAAAAADTADVAATTDEKASSSNTTATVPVSSTPQSGKDLGVWTQSLEDGANYLSLWTLHYLNPLLRLGAGKVLDAQDVGIPSDQDRAQRAHEAAYQAWKDQTQKANAYNAPLKEAHQQALDQCHTEEERAKVQKKAPSYKEPSMSASLVTSFGGWRLTMALFFYILSALLSFVPVLILNDLVRYFEYYAANGTGDGFDFHIMGDVIDSPWVLVAGLGIIPVLMSLLQTRHQAIMAHCGVFVRTAVSTLLYQKSLHVSAAGRAKTSTGQVVNMMVRCCFV